MYRSMSSFYYFLAILSIFQLRDVVGSYDKRCLGCRPATVEDNPFMVQVLRHIKQEWLFRCNGVLYSAKAVLTAGVCVRSENTTLSVQDLGVVTSDSKMRCFKDQNEDKYKNILIKLEYAAEVYTEGYPALGVAVLILEKSVIENLYTWPIKARRFAVETYEVCQIYSFGLTATDTVSGELRGGEFIVLDPSLCAEKHKIPRAAICARGFNMTYQTCVADTGAPLVCNRQLLGLVEGRRAECERVANPALIIRIEPLIYKIDQIITSRKAWGNIHQYEQMDYDGRDIEESRRKIAGL